MSAVLVAVHYDGEDWVYSRYEGKVRTHRFWRALELSKEWVEEIRRDPGQFDEGTEPSAA